MLTNADDGNEDGHQHPEQEEGEEDADVRVSLGPSMPSKSERERHEVTHIPFRSWCPVCVAGRGVKAAHKKRNKTEHELPRFAMDYGFLGQEGQELGTMLVIREWHSGMMFAMLVPRKGIGERWVEERIAKFINDFGIKKFILRSDGEPSIVALRNNVVRLCEGEVKPEDAIKGESQSNGLAEVVVKIIAGVVRTLKIHVEVNAKMDINNDSVFLAWLVEHACTRYNRCTVGGDGKTPWQRAYGKSPALPLIPIGEKVLFKKLQSTGAHKNSLAPKFTYGVYVGSRPRSGEHYIAAAGSVVRSRNVRRLSQDQRWDKEEIQKIRGTPAAPTDGKKVMDVPTIVITKEVEEEDMKKYNEEAKVRRVKINKADVKKFGATKKVPWLQGG